MGMRQTTLSVALEVKPESFDHLSGLLDALRDRRSQNPSGGTGPFADFLTTVPAVHFMSLTAFPGFDYDPLFVIEANFDGAPGPFWAQLETAIGPDLRAFLRCCKRPLDHTGPLYDAVTALDSRAPIAPYLEARTLTPTVYHHGNRGMTRDRILDEGKLFLGTRTELAQSNDGGPSPYRKLTPVEIHAKLRAALLPQFGWLDQKAPARIPFTQSVGDYLRLAWFVLLVVFALSIPGLVLKSQLSWQWYVALCVGLFAVFTGVLYRMGKPLPGTATPTRFSFLTFFLRHLLVPVAIAVAAYVAIAATVSAPVWSWLGHKAFWPAWKDMAIWAAWSGASIAVTVAGILVWLRWLERRDASQDAPPVDPKMLREMARREDWIPQNHMGSVVLIKPGVLRAILIRVGHHGLHLLLRAQKAARNGYLGSMRTIHFAHWARVNNDSRLMFFSNFDQTWESYLDDFIEKAHAGLTLAWSSGVGFPPTRFLVKDGASHGRQFKEWARHSMAVSRFWYSAYKDLTAEQVERNYRIACGLRKKQLSEKEAAAWINDL
ncbi:hypothetical protein [Sphingomonas kyeonggiensis]|uniref:Uncharacterized protein n=1 Tax=Sphingomonas kyeonggiensis TaxID=1268553 RepID=A0A7W6NZH2_9SPHN|nr:hypothetical protein [Sphingomonas kyeonggiensis]MBB4101393.1 hypothetical protein [Sphingomonas kyeonggiensis]